MTDLSNRQFCEAMLPKVSRTFAACIGLLPKQLSYEVLLAYLLCRIADTIEDHPSLPGARKRELLNVFTAALGGASLAPLHQAFDQHREGPEADHQLTREAHRVIAEFRALSPAAQKAIRPWVVEMCEGMADFACDQRVHETSQGVSALLAMEDLDRYCYYVAGTVGHMLTDLFPLHHRRLTQSHYRRLRALATSFGLGLQLTNIIKDVADDARRGWSFVPRDLCSRHRTSPEALLDPQAAGAAQAVMNDLIAKAQGHLDDALAYCLALPRSAYRIRLFCLTPMFFAVRTLHRARHDPQLLNPDHKVKISRREVYAILRATMLVAPNNHLVRTYYRRLKGTPPDLKHSLERGAV